MGLYTLNGLAKHNRQNHAINNGPRKFQCEYCNEYYSSKQSKCVYVKKCREINSKTLIEKFNKLSEKIETLEKNPYRETIINCNNLLVSL